ncbi:CRISPR-associated protein Cas4 [Saccharolobus islandicus]|uniref:CRISPR-associated exonuclease Cas4 n=2 Tax=Saccharolobus islandicus TaxID=43080 RepID=M9U709_SACIS|nr:CRISPR-associated protein Cas4 [Sulfolobus islandicus]ADX84844.1 CRISPR-associated protein Cas4 [Sulfolobus islandicus REY15A]AGJ61868.1 CRISPR-associated protein, Cas4, putative RecB family exonuclease [Sulfolobus islandicus LAL14/1]
MVSVTDLKDFTLCPVIPWIRKKLGWREPVTEGQRIAKNVKPRELANDLPDPKYYEVYMRDKSTGLSGIVDVLAKDIVAEIKAFNRRFYGHFRIQLLSYAYLAERNGFRVKDAILILGREKRLKIEIRKEHIEYVERITNKLVESLEEDSPPVANPSPKLCEACQYRRVCPLSVIL